MKDENVIKSKSLAFAKRIVKLYKYLSDEKKEYVLNTNTMKIHNPSCSSVEDILPHNYATTKDFDGAIADGYSPCGRCHPLRQGHRPLHPGRRPARF